MGRRVAVALATIPLAIGLSATGWVDVDQTTYDEIRIGQQYKGDS